MCCGWISVFRFLIIPPRSRHIPVMTWHGIGDCPNFHCILSQFNIHDSHMGDDEKFIYTPTLPPTRTHTQLQKFKLGDKIKQYQEMLSLYAQVTMQDLYAPDFNIAGAVNHIVQSSLFSHLIPPEPAPVIAGTPSTIWKAKIAKLTAAVRLAILIPPELAQVIQTKLAGNDGNGGGVSWGTLHAFGTCTIKMPCLFWRKSDFPDESGFVDRDYHNFLCHRARQVDYAIMWLETGVPVVNFTGHRMYTRHKAWKWMNCRDRALSSWRIGSGNECQSWSTMSSPT
jgi:hypothetical protein